MKKNGLCRIADVALLLLSAVLCVGVKLVFHACGAMEDGSYMHCHSAENAVFAAAIALVVLALLLCLLRARIARAVIAFVTTVLALVTAFIPQNIVHLCMMPDMRCRSIMRPAVLVCSLLIAAAALLSALLSLRAKEDAAA